MRFPWRQVIVLFFGLAFAVVILERAGGFSLVFERGLAATGGFFRDITPPAGGRSTTAYAANLRRLG